MKKMELFACANATQDSEIIFVDDKTIELAHGFNRILNNDAICISRLIHLL